MVPNNLSSRNGASLLQRKQVKANSFGLNDAQRRAAVFNEGHALVLAGAGCGKTSTIDGRLVNLVSIGVRTHEIAVLTFTRRAGDEIIERVEASLAGRAKGLQASTFHGLCIKLIRNFPNLFGCQGFSIIDSDDQRDLFKAVLGRYSQGTTDNLPTVKQLVSIYSFGRNTRCTPTEAILNEDVVLLKSKEHIIKICREYKKLKETRRYLDYDDILEVVANRLNEDASARNTVCRQFKHILVDEFQDTNPLQWHLLEPFLEHASLFCVGDDAQSIYGFRGADFDHVHKFKEKVPDSTTLKLTENYRSTQEILDVSNWLLERSSINYDKRLVAARGSGNMPRLLNFSDEWREASWVAADIAARHTQGDPWGRHMILVRTKYSARALELCLIEKGIPYVFIGGTKLLETGHVKDLLSVLRIIANPEDEIAWMRYLRLWPGIGPVKAAAIVKRVLGRTSRAEAMKELDNGVSDAGTLLREVLAAEGQPVRALAIAVEGLSETLAESYKKDWGTRREDFQLVEKLTEKHTSLRSFIDSYLLDPLNVNEVRHGSTSDVVFLITVHSAKGTERKICYVTNVSPGAYPSARAIGSEKSVEEERRVLYVALTRAEDELIITRHGTSRHGFGQAETAVHQGSVADAYFLNDLPDGLVDEEFH